LKPEVWLTSQPRVSYVLPQIDAWVWSALTWSPFVISGALALAIGAGLSPQEHQPGASLAGESFWK
jgi:hypothetical protein